MLKFFLWLRYLRKRKIVILSVAAVALSTALLIVVSNLFNGFIKTFEKASSEMLGDIVVAPAVKFPKYDLFIAQLEKDPLVSAATPLLSVPGLMNLGNGNVRAVVINGIEPESKSKVTEFKSFLLRQKDLPGPAAFKLQDNQLSGFISVAVFAEPDEITDEYNWAAIDKMIGEDVIITTGAVQETGVQVSRKTAKVKVADIVFSGAYFLDKTFVYLPIEQVQKILYPGIEGKYAEQIHIKINKQIPVEQSLDKVRQLWTSFAKQNLGWDDFQIEQTSVMTSKQMQAPYVAEFRKQMNVLLLIFGVVSLSVVLLIFCIFYMIVVTKTRDIAIIKSCGATDFSAGSIFLGFGACVGIAGAILGTFIAVLITRNINIIERWITILSGLKIWKSSTYMFSRIPNEMDWMAAMPILAFAVLAAALGAVVPAIIAAKTKPVDVLRYE